MNGLLQQYRKETENELQNILAYWMKFTFDFTNGGFYGKIDNANNIDEDAPKGSVLNSRILWAFSAGYNLTHKPAYLQTAQRAFQYISRFFYDKKFGGIYWSVDKKGNPLDTKKQMYALSFAIYGACEYYIASKDETSKQLAVDLYNDIVKHSYDTINGGYIEALTRDWKEIEDLRLSAKDFNEKKSMNTHLHILEGFANLYKIFPDEILKQKIVELIRIFLDRIIDKETHHLILFFDEEWNAKSDIISYGHDIEAAWLVQEAAEIIHEEALLQTVKDVSVKIAMASESGLDKEGGLWYEKEADHWIKEKHWWPQSEAMVGFYNAYQITGNEHFLNRSLDSWKFVQNHLIDKQNGEWIWGINEDYSVMLGQDKVGMWKCPYHNARACIEILKRIKAK